MLQHISSYIFFYLPLLSYITTCAQLCNPYTASPCVSCQPYSYLSGGLCYCLTGYYIDTTTQAN